MNEPSLDVVVCALTVSSFLTSQKNKESWRNQVMTEKNFQFIRNKDIKDKVWML